MFFGDQFGNFFAIGQFGETQKISLTPNTASLVTLETGQIYRIISLDIIYLKQSSSDTVVASTDDALLMYETEAYLNTLEGKKYLSIISETSCDVFITKMT